MLFLQKIDSIELIMEGEMDVYSSFAQVYDLFMDNVPYDEWCAFLCELFKREDIWDGEVVDLGCGTGTLTRKMAAKGYHLTGIDNAAEMLSVASQTEGNENILYSMQDMQAFELPGPVKAIYSACDCMNYLTEKEDLLKTFRCSYRYLNTGGIFVFDMNTPYKYRELLGENTIAESREEGSFIWENYYDEEEKINEYYLTLFVQEQEDLYRKYEEFHYQRCYEPEEVLDLLKKAGFKEFFVYEAYTNQPLKEDSERMMFVARKCL